MPVLSYDGRAHGDISGICQLFCDVVLIFSCHKCLVRRYLFGVVCAGHTHSYILGLQWFLDDLIQSDRYRVYAGSS